MGGNYDRLAMCAIEVIIKFATNLSVNIVMRYDISLTYIPTDPTLS